MAQAPEIIKQIRSALASVTPQQAEREIARLDEEIRALQDEQNTWRMLHGLAQQLGGSSPGGNGAGSSVAEDIPPLRQAILSVMNEKREGTGVRLAELSADLQERGWLSDSKNDNHRLQMMASTLVKENKLFRPAKGVYQLASGNSGAQVALSEAHENGDSEPLSTAPHPQEGQT
jgi:hypothetical protein